MPTALFQKGNKVALGHKAPPPKPFAKDCRTFMETGKGWEKLVRWANSKNWKASLTALQTIIAYGYGKPKEQIKLESDIPQNLRALFIELRNGSPNGFKQPFPGGDSAGRPQLANPSTSTAGVVHEGDSRIIDVVEQANGHSGEHP